MRNHTVSNRGHAQLFASKYLEFFTTSNPLASWCTYLLIISGMLYYAFVEYGVGIKLISFVFFSGLLFWSFFEYVTHRYIFHWISTNPGVEKLTYLIHGNHHHFPKDKKRLFMPLLPGVIMATDVFTIMYLIAGRWAFLFFPGFISGHLFQSSLHYAIHAWRPPFKWMKFLWRNHHLHHYSNEHKGFGISSPIWDFVFKTQFDLKKHIEDESKVKTLIFEKPVSKSLPPTDSSTINYHQPFKPGI